MAWDNSPGVGHYVQLSRERARHAEQVATLASRIERLERQVRSLGAEPVP